MKNTEATKVIESNVYGKLTREQAIAILMARTVGAPKPVAAFSNGTPQGGWTDEDRIK